ncbi:hypothetical protein B0H11DRAFT_1924684 [Mycena galericulata]|nr:hypothetical protein B0H11DRAFT_1924684 [Mycena galericulata]
MSVIVLFLANHDFNFVAASGDSVTSSAESDPVPAGAVEDEARNMRPTKSPLSTIIPTHHCRLLELSKALAAGPVQRRSTAQVIDLELSGRNIIMGKRRRTQSTRAAEAAAARMPSRKPGLSRRSTALFRRRL